MKGEYAIFRFDADLAVEHVHAFYRKHRFPPHSHADYLVGLTTEGTEDFVQAGQPGRSAAGSLRTINPGVVHEGGSLPGKGWGYRALFLPPERMRRAIAAAGQSGLPILAGPVITNADVARAFTRLSETLVSTADAADREAALTDFLALLVEHAILGAGATAQSVEREAVRRVREHLMTEANKRVTLEQLVEIAGISKFHLIRVFRAETGLTPWQFQTQARIDMARRLLAIGEPASQVAAACGFVDQSHLTRRFRRIVGTTPAAYRGGIRSGLNNQVVA
ncbi:helix-turn-helix domain-containing protein [Sphingomonas sp. SFZ2018-12]|uniref:helix-turn-helix transcriptional regulator n=1 Tax=Sphingomonas sp. SFZ2018-12 TaxID=2683197 RepID=UPI001F0F8D9B|nr:AraC family transcriptional regulator [Sphingomonas sp. SFZ2018-12]MCH4894859.1 helix-turn-helix domain-containing protein [Sphingomonas sp. SFZ2018-12]